MPFRLGTIVGNGPAVAAGEGELGIDRYREFENWIQ